MPALGLYEGTIETLECRLAYMDCVNEKGGTAKDQTSCASVIAKCGTLLPAPVTAPIVARAGHDADVVSDTTSEAESATSASTITSTAEVVTSSEAMLPGSITIASTDVSGGLIVATSLTSTTSHNSATLTSMTTTFQTSTASSTTVDPGTATDTTTTTFDSNGTTNKLSVGAKAGIGVAAAIGGLFILALVAYVFWRIGRGDRVVLSFRIWKKHAEEEETGLAPTKQRQSAKSSRQDNAVPWIPRSPVELPPVPIPVPELSGSVPPEISKEKEVVHEMQEH